MKPLILGIITVCLISWSTAAQEKDPRLMSVFSIVQFPNQVCETTSESGVYGTCYTEKECTDRGGRPSGTCAAGFGMCCYQSTSTCGDTISNNNTYLINPSFPSTYTPTATGTCVFTIDKVTDNICQLRLDFQTFSGFVVPDSGICTDKFAITGSDGLNPPEICGTNTGYHMYLQMGQNSGDTAKVTVTYGDTASAKHWRVLVRQIECDNPGRAPADCTQYFTGTTGNIQNYGHASGDWIAALNYQICMRTEQGYCGITYSQSTATSPDPFQIIAAATTTTAKSKAGECSTIDVGYVKIPKTSTDGVTPILTDTTNVPNFPTTFCGADFGLEGALSTELISLTSVQRPFTVNVFSVSDDTQNEFSTGFNLNYNQVTC